MELYVKHLLILLTIFSFSYHAFADGVGLCADDTYRKEEIGEYYPQEIAWIYNSKGQEVGAFTFNRVLEEVETLHLCGANSGFYYAEGAKLSEIFKSNGFEKVISYNDEYGVDYSNIRTIRNDSNFMTIEFTISVYPEMDPEDADYAAFTETLFVHFDKSYMAELIEF